LIAYPAGQQYPAGDQPLRISRLLRLRKNKGPALLPGLRRHYSLTMSYFHTGIRTIIGAEAFHCPVRDGKEWGHLAMVIRLNFLLCCLLGSKANS
jgi:hypothetical protein